MKVELHKLPEDYIEEGDNYPRILIFYRDKKEKEIDLTNEISKFLYKLEKEEE